MPKSNKIDPKTFEEEGFEEGNFEEGGFEEGFAGFEEGEEFEQGGLDSSSEDSDSDWKEPYLDSDGFWRKTFKKTRFKYELEMDLDDDQKKHFAGQLEAAAGALYQYFLKKNNAADTEFDKQTLEVKSRNIPSLTLWGHAYKAEDKTINGYPIEADGTLWDSEKARYIPVKGLPGIGVAAWFLGENDLHEENFGLVDQETKLRGKKFDHDQTFVHIYKPIVFSDIYLIFDNDPENAYIGYAECVNFPEEIKKLTETQQKEYKMAFKIMNTPTEVFAEIIDRYIDSKFCEEKERIR